MTIEELHEEIDAINAQIKANNLRWEAGLTGISHLTSEQFAQRLGAIPEQPPITDMQLDLTSLPGAVDWNSQNYVFPVEDQAQCNSCVGFSTSQCVAANALIAQQSPIPEGINGTIFIATYMPSPAPPYFCTGNNCTAGMLMSTALDYIQNSGNEYLTTVPYYNPIHVISYQAICPTLPGDDTVYQISGWFYQTNTNQIKAWLAQQGTMVTSMEVYPSFKNYPTINPSQSPVYEPLPGETPIGNHAVHVVGYNEALQAWVCQNSWGTDWGLDGYFYVAYNTCNIIGMYGINGFTQNPIPTP